MAAFLNSLVGIFAVVGFLLLLAGNSALGDRYADILQWGNLSVLLVFVVDVLYRFFASADKRDHLRHNWFDLIVFVPFVQIARGVADLTLGVAVRELVIVAMLISRVRRANRFIAFLRLRPAQMMVLSFLTAIGAGAVLLTLPAATVSGERLDLVDALFTSTSATCVTGLIVRDTGAYFNHFGQMVILGLIQLGGLGIMTFSVSLALILRRQVDVQQQVTVKDVLGYEALEGARKMVLFIVVMTACFELAGFLALTIAWWGRFGGMAATLYHAAFHSVSAFCNAGFSTFSDSLIRFQGHLPTNAIVGLLIVCGGLGFTVIKDVAEAAGERLRHGKAFRLRVQTRLVLHVSVLLIIGGAVLIYLFESPGALAGMSPKDRILASVFQSVTARTAGFNTCDLVRFSGASLFLVIVLMFIGASPGSTGGGIKTTTFAVLWATVASSLRQREQVELHRRTIPWVTIRKAISVLFLSLLVVGISTVMLASTEGKRFVEIAFEAVSAFGTVGLSTGVTPELTTRGKLIVTVLMFIGRIGPLTVAYAFAQRRHQAKYVYAEERVMIG